MDLRSDRLYDLVNDIPDVMGFRAIQPSAAIVKVMSVPDSHCVRVVTPDDHVNIGFHEILIHDLEEEELLFVALGCLRLKWPKTLFTLMSRYQFDLDQMRKDCRERFVSAQSGTCTTCGKHIQQNLGRHIALYRMELAQLWRCQVTCCTVWKGTAQDCVDHMRRAHDIPPLVKVANLAQWSSMSRPAVSGIAVNTLLFSRIGVPLFYRYRVFNHSGTHGAFRGAYMRRMHAFLEESDAALLRWRHRRCSRDIAARMSWTSLRDTEDRTPDVSSVYTLNTCKTPQMLHYPPPPQHKRALNKEQFEVKPLTNLTGPTPTLRPPEQKLSNIPGMYTYSITIQMECTN